MIECKTYRIRGHSRSDRNLYRTKEEIESWRKRDPIELLEAELEALGLASREQIEAIRAQVEVEIKRGVAFAEASPVPSAEDLLRDVYTT